MSGHGDLSSVLARIRPRSPLQWAAVRHRVLVAPKTGEKCYVAFADQKTHETPAKAGIPLTRHIPHYATLPENPCKSE